MQEKVLGSILHGAYGDVYEQALCLKDLKRREPSLRLRLYAATDIRLDAFRALDLSFAESFEHWSVLLDDDRVEKFVQFQIRDTELQQDVLAKLPRHQLAKFDQENVLLPWVWIRQRRLFFPENRLGLSPEGNLLLDEHMRANGLDQRVWSRPTVGFLWRYRGEGGVIAPWLQRPAPALVEKYSSVLRSLIAELGCHVLVSGMKLQTTDHNRARTDNKYPEYGLDLPTEHCTYLKGLNWPIEVEMHARCNVCSGHPSGFTEALWLRRGGDVIVVDPLPHYLLKGIGRRIPIFGLNTLQGVLRAASSHSSTMLHRHLKAALRRTASLP